MTNLDRLNVPCLPNAQLTAFLLSHGTLELCVGRFCFLEGRFRVCQSTLDLLQLTRLGHSSFLVLAKRVSELSLGLFRSLDTCLVPLKLVGEANCLFFRLQQSGLCGTQLDAQGEQLAIASLSLGDKLRPACKQEGETSTVC